MCYRPAGKFLELIVLNHFSLFASFYVVNDTTTPTEVFVDVEILVHTERVIGRIAVQNAVKRAYTIYTFSGRLPPSVLFFWRLHSE